MSEKPEDFIKGAAQVVEHYGEWPRFHDGLLIAINIDCSTATAEATLDLRDAEYPLKKSTLISLRWEGVTKLQLASTSLDGVLYDVAFSEIEGGTETRFASKTGGFAGQICAARVAVTRYEPVEE